MTRELRIFLTAVMYYTRIPCPKWVGHEPEFLSLATRYIPVIGWIVGSVYSTTVVIALLVFPALISVLLGIAATILLTGAFHEDGFADVCDGFGGGWTREKILTIMKDSRVGTYGIVGLVLMLAVKTAATYELVDSAIPTAHIVTLFITSHTLSRFMATTLIHFSSYAREDQDSKAKPVATGFTTQNLAIAAVLAGVPLAILLQQTGWVYGLVLIPMALATAWLARYFKKWIGGYTGDCLGATQQVNEVIFLLTILALWKSF